MKTHSIQNVLDQVIDKVGKDIRLATPLGAGKANQFINALYHRAKQDPTISLTIYTALTLSAPRGKLLLEKRFLEPLVKRIFGAYPELEYELDRARNKLPDNISVKEFYFQAGKQLHSRKAQEDYICTNYTHVARDLLDQNINVIAQIVAPSDDGQQFSLSCNPDITLDLLEGIEADPQWLESSAFVAQVNLDLPYMYGEAVVKKDRFHFILDDPELTFPVFAPPKTSVSPTDYLIGFYASTLIKDDGEIQVGIGSLGDAIVYALLLRHKDNQTYWRILHDLGIDKTFGSIIKTKGGLKPFQKGLFGATEMMVDGFMHLINAGIIKKQVYDHVILQRLLNEGLITESVDAEMLYHLLERRAIQPKLSQKDFDFLSDFCIFRENLKFESDHIILEDGIRINANLNNDDNHQAIIENCLGTKLTNGAIVHGGFFLGPRDFYEWLKTLPKPERRLIHMKSVTKINHMYGHEELDRLHRKNARFVNTCLKMTLSGAAVSDGLEDGRVISGVGGQYNFVAMAQALPDGYSILQLRSTRYSRGKLQSNIVFNYGHITIPRHLRDIVITEYGIADIRGKTDSQVAAALIEIADSRFQNKLIKQAKAAGKLDESYQLPEWTRLNTPGNALAKFKGFRKDDLFPPFPFGTDFSDEEIALGGALKLLKKVSGSKFQLVSTIVKSFFHIAPASKYEALLERMGLSSCSSLIEWGSRKLLLYALSTLDLPTQTK
ncbi:acetyl-CoA hydrolase/transferase C-terminal domain-containing protein [Pseudomonadota bacterium]